MEPFVCVREQGSIREEREDVYVGDRACHGLDYGPCREYAGNHTMDLG